ncbi:MAG: sensor histidine kinase [Clostridiales bacterium]|nr:sensor histidine kinase [Clostridiales bacterium]
MNLQKRNLILLISLPFMLTVLLVMWDTAMHDFQWIGVRSENGVWDLTSFDFSGDEEASLEGAVEFIPEALLTPEAFAARESEVQIGDPEAVSQFATSRMRALMPDDGYYALMGRSIDYADRLFVNGAYMLEFGSPGATKQTNVPGTGLIYITVKADGGVIEIIRQGSNFVHRDGGGPTGLRLMRAGLVGNKQAPAYIVNILMGCFLALFFVHLMLFCLLHNYRANVYFALFCLMWFLRMGVTNPRVFTVLLPWLSWVVKFRIEYLAFPVSAALFVLLLNVLFPGILQKKFFFELGGVSAVAAGVFLFADTVFMSYALLYVEGVYVVAIAYIVVRFAVKIRRINLEQGIFLTGAALFIYACLHDMLDYNSLRFLYPPGDMSEISMLIFAFFEATAIFIATMREVEETKAAEQRLAADNAALERVNRLRSSLMETVTHEIRTPLAVMSVYAQLATETLRISGVDAQTTTDLKMISDEAKRLADMANGLLGLTKEQEDIKTREPLAIGPLVEQIARLCAPALSKNRNRLNMRVTKGLPPIFGNAGECAGLLWNLLTNAARHTHDGEITVSARTSKDKIIIVVADTGEGIAPEVLPHVFERGFAGMEGRSGLGLAICREIAETHGGELTIESEQGEWTAVTLMLPICKGEEYHDG